MYELDIMNQGGWGGSSDWDNGSSESWQGWDNCNDNQGNGMNYLRSLSMMSSKAPVETSNRLEPIAEAPAPSGSSMDISIEQLIKPTSKKKGLCSKFKMSCGCGCKEEDDQEVDVKRRIQEIDKKCIEAERQATFDRLAGRVGEERHCG